MDVLYTYLMNLSSIHIRQVWRTFLSPPILLLTTGGRIASLTSIFMPVAMGWRQFIPPKGPFDLEFNHEPCFGQQKETEVLVFHFWASDLKGSGFQLSRGLCCLHEKSVAGLACWCQGNTWDTAGGDTLSKSTARTNGTQPTHRRLRDSTLII